MVTSLPFLTATKSGSPPVGAKTLIALTIFWARVLRADAEVVSVMVKLGLGVTGIILLPLMVIPLILIADGEVQLGNPVPPQPNVSGKILILPTVDLEIPAHLARV